MRMRKCRRGPLLLVAGMILVCYVYSWIISAIYDPDTDWLDVRLQRSDMLTHKPDPTKPPVHFRHHQIRERCGPPKGPPPLGAPNPLGPSIQPLRPPLRFPMDPLISRDPNLFFCPLAKAGSTFFTRYLIAMKKPGPMESPFKIDISGASRQKQPTFLSIRPPKEQMKFLNQSLKAVFTRNPYSRIFSAYVDKLFSPNPYYWKIWGAPSVVVNKLKKEDYPCGSQISFKYFIKYVIQKLWQRDLHFIPMDTMCKFCDVGYDLVGRVEDSITDIDYLSQRLNINSSFLHEKSYKMSSIEDAIKDSTNDALSVWRKEISQCISQYDSGRIIWRKLQIRGLFDANIEFPFNEEEIKSVSLEDFRKACFKAVNNSVDASRLKRQKLIAYQYAYKALPQMDILKLQNIYKRDFMLLDYDNTRPDAFISSLGGLETSDPFDFETPWTFT